MLRDDGAGEATHWSPASNNREIGQMELSGPTTRRHRSVRGTQPAISAPRRHSTAPGHTNTSKTGGSRITGAQQPTRFRPSNYMVDLNNTTNPPPPQIMVKPAVMLRREERPQPVTFSVTAPSQLVRTLSEMGSGSGTPETTYSELAAILLSSGRRDQAIDISTEVLGFRT